MDTFDPVKYSTPENTFLLENIGTTPAVALQSPPPAGVNPRAVRPILQEVVDRVAIEETKGVSWAGTEALKNTISAFLRLDAKWADDFERTRGRIPRFPTMYTKDAKGKYWRGGPGSDVSHPRTWIDDDGKRHRFAVNLDGYDASVDVEPGAVAPTELIHDADKHRWECPICNHTESYRQESRSSENAAKARMMKHLKNPQGKETSLHRELYTSVSHS
jgi:hypothetical protein